MAETKDSIFPLKLPAELVAAMDQAAFGLSSPGHLVTRAQFIRAAIQEKVDRTSKEVRPGGKKKTK